ncbi:reverse transcriptase domain-containing protein [Tanacetum coccineum]|uniref:Reverse transcriptase domain-containing protein n=1 Tax=Tanacetum coccineum TaxID=301880 RepID=A0ABQ5BDU5_9ASTR
MLKTLRTSSNSIGCGSSCKREEDVATYHLSRLKNSYLEMLIEREIADEFPDKHIMLLKSKFNDDELCETLKILAHCHSGLAGGHHSANVTAKKVYESGFYWPSVFKDANEYVRRCDVCQRSRNISSRNEMPLNNIQLFARFGVPKALISDRGAHFWNSHLEKALLRYGMTHKLSLTYHPQSNGQTEVTNRAIKRILERSLGYNLKDWSEKFNDVLWAFRTAYKTLTGCTPLRLVYGKACHLLVDIEDKSHWALKQCNTDLTLASKSCLMQLHELAELRDDAYENTRIYKEQTKKWHDSRLCGNKDFKVGDKVLLYNSHLKMYPGKLKSKWSGPNIVKRVYPYRAVEIIDKNGFSFKVNGQRLKKYYEGNIDKEDDEVIEFDNGSVFPDSRYGVSNPMDLAYQESNLKCFVAGIPEVKAYLNGVDASAIFSFRSLVIKKVVWKPSCAIKANRFWADSNYRLIREKIVSSQKLESIYEIKGHWDRDVTIKDTCNGKTTVIYGAKDVISALKTLIVKDAESASKQKMTLSRPGKLLRGLVKLQAIIRGHLVRHQAVTTLKHLQSVVNIQSQACAKRVQVVDCTSHNNYQDYRRKDIKRDSTSLTSQNSELKFRLQAMEQQAQIRDVMSIAQIMENEFPNQDLSIFGIGGVETGSDDAEFILLSANTVQVKLVKFTIANRRNGFGQGFRLAQLQDQLPRVKLVKFTIANRRNGLGQGFRLAQLQDQLPRVKLVKFTIANRRNGLGQGFRLAQLQDQLPSNEPRCVDELCWFFHRRVLPPHLSPFVDAEAEGYVTEYADTTKRLQAAAIYIPLSGWLLSHHLEYLDWIL